MPANHTPDSATLHSQPEIQLPSALHSWRQEIFQLGGVGVLRERVRRNQFAWHQHEQLQLLLVLGDAVGEAEWKNQDNEPVRQRLTGDMVWMVPPGRAHALDWMTDAELIALYCDREWAASFGKNLADVSVEPLASYVQHYPLVGELCRELRESCHEGNPRSDDVAALGLALATRLLRSHCAHFPQGPKRWNMLPASIRRLLDHIDLHLEEDLSTPVLASLAGLSENYLSEVFRDYTGLPPQLYIVRKRIVRVKELLQSGHYTVGEVAYMAGFADQAHLDRHFRDFCGAPPSVWMARLERDGRQPENKVGGIAEDSPNISENRSSP